MRRLLSYIFGVFILFPAHSAVSLDYLEQMDEIPICIGPADVCPGEYDLVTDDPDIFFKGYVKFAKIEAHQNLLNIYTEPGVRGCDYSIPIIWQLCRYTDRAYPDADNYPFGYYTDYFWRENGDDQLGIHAKGIAEYIAQAVADRWDDDRYYGDARLLDTEEEEFALLYARTDYFQPHVFNYYIVTRNHGFSIADDLINATETGGFIIGIPYNELHEYPPYLDYPTYPASGDCVPGGNDVKIGVPFPVKAGDEWYNIRIQRGSVGGGVDPEIPGQYKTHDNALAVRIADGIADHMGCEGVALDENGAEMSGVTDEIYVVSDAGCDYCYSEAFSVAVDRSYLTNADQAWIEAQATRVPMLYAQWKKISPSCVEYNGLGKSLSASASPVPVEPLGSNLGDSGRGYCTGSSSTSKVECVFHFDQDSNRVFKLQGYTDDGELDHFDLDDAKIEGDYSFFYPSCTAQPGLLGMEIDSMCRESCTDSGHCTIGPPCTVTISASTVSDKQCQNPSCDLSNFDEVYPASTKIFRVSESDGIHGDFEMLTHADPEDVTYSEQ